MYQQAGTVIGQVNSECVVTSVQLGIVLVVVSICSTFGRRLYPRVCLHVRILNPYLLKRKKFIRDECELRVIALLLMLYCTNRKWICRWCTARYSP